MLSYSQILFLFVLAQCLSCQVENQSKKENSYSFFVADDTLKTIVVQNTSTKTLQFRYHLNDRFFLRPDDLVARYQDSTAQLHKTLWRWTYHHTLSGAPVSQERWWHQPSLFMNSSAFGFCDDKAVLLAALWKKAGFPSRIWTLGGHIVPEVKIGDQWQMYDPFVGAYFTDDSGRVLSVERIAAGQATQIGTTERRELLAINPTLSDQVFQDSFLSQKNNAVQALEDWVWPLPFSSQFQLPGGASLECCRPLRWPNGEKALGLDLILPPGTKGSFYLPLIMIKAKGTSLLVKKNDKKNIRIEGDYQPNVFHYPQAYFLEQVEDTTRLTFAVNARLEPFRRGNNRLSLIGRGVDRLQIRRGAITGLNDTETPALFSLNPSDTLYLEHWNRFNMSVSDSQIRLTQLREMTPYFQWFLQTGNFDKEKKNKIERLYIDRIQRIRTTFSEKERVILLSKLDEPERLFLIFHQYFYQLNDKDFDRFLAALQRQFQNQEVPEDHASK